MKRREFLKWGFLGTAGMSGVAGFGWPFSSAYASHSTGFVSRTLAHIMLGGGADLRYVFVPGPDYDPAYVEQFWRARSALYNGTYSDYASMFESEYLLVEDPKSGLSFGVHNSCAWLAEQFAAGNVAVISNVFGSLNRRHDHSQLIVNAGDQAVNRLETDRDGWGGRLVEFVGGDSKVVSVSSNVPVLCNGSDPGNRTANVFHGQDMRNIALPSADISRSPTDRRNVINRALLAYYKKRAMEIESEKPLDWPYRQFFRHHSSLRTFGDAINSRLLAHPLPPLLENLVLNDPEFGLQCKNLYDNCVVSDILNVKVVSMNYGGWDHHASMQAAIENNARDVFGASGGLNAVSTQLETDFPGASNNLVYLFSSDFGRQLAANGSNGTDHGRASYSILIGNSVSGGVYGDMFPTREAQPEPSDSLGRSPFEIHGSDIEGLTSFERVLAAACDWAAPGAGATVFPNSAASGLEPNVDLTGLFPD